jgi:hypothetical protein
MKHIPEAFGCTSILAVALTAVLPAQMASQPPPSSLPIIERSLSPIDRAIALSADYLERASGPDGKFVYRVAPDSGHVSSSYNIVRHAGAIYALDVFNGSHPDRSASDAMIRAANFMRANYISQDSHSRTLVVWSRRLPTKSDADLGAAGLGLVALTGVHRVEPSAAPVAELQSLGHFITFLQNTDGSFASKYNPDAGPVGDWQSLYYAGEAALGLIALYELDHSREWLVAAGKALAYLAKSRAGVQKLPADHWALIATAKFLPYYDRSGCPASRDELLEHAGRICTRILREQITDAPDARLDGGFDPDGRTTPTSTRLEGLLAELEFLPENATDFRTRIETSVDRGIAFLLRSQIATGPYAGGIPGAVFGAGSVVLKANAGASDIRIDYVQHALCALLRYQSILQRRVHEHPNR